MRDVMSIGMIFFLIVFLAIFIWMIFYVGRRLYQFLKYLKPNVPWYSFTIVYLIMVATLFIDFMSLTSKGAYVVAWIGAHWMGIFMYFLLFFVIADIVLLLMRLLKKDVVTENMRFIFRLSAVVVALLLCSYGFYNAMQIKEVAYDVKLSDAGDAKGLKIVLISDVHLGAVKSENRLEEIVQKINAKNPDIVAIAGDLFNDDYTSLKNTERAKELFRSIEAKYGVYASLGNHDSGKTFKQMVQFMKDCNMKLLNDEYVVIDNRLVLIGRVDSSPIRGFDGLVRKSIEPLFNQLDSSLPVIVMDHNPENVGQYGENVDLILSGHTHKGQVFPANLVTKMMYEVDYGHGYLGENRPQIVVSSGVGTWGMPMRVATNNEIVTITIR